MSDEKKPNRTIINVLPETLKAQSGKEYPADLVQEAFIRSEQGVKGFCRRFGLSPAQLQKYIEAGDWARLKEEYRDRMFNILNSERENILERKQSIIQRVELFKLLHVEKVIEDLEDYAMEFGDFFVRDDEGEIVRDGYGNPVSKKIALDKRDMEFLKDLESAREINRKILEEHEKVKQLEEKKDDSVIDVGGYFNDD